MSLHARGSAVAGCRSFPSHGLDQMVLGPRLDRGVVDEDVDELALEGIGPPVILTVAPVDP